MLGSTTGLSGKCWCHRLWLVVPPTGRAGYATPAQAWNAAQLSAVLPSWLEKVSCQKRVLLAARTAREGSVPWRWKAVDNVRTLALRAGPGVWGRRCADTETSGRLLLELGRGAA